jgi:sarcosine oxidase
VFDRGDDAICLLPNLGAGIKVGLQQPGPSVDPDDMDRRVTPEDMARVRRHLERVAPGLSTPLRWQVATYSSVADEEFVIDRPWVDGPLLVAACSGHGFKLAPAIGELVARALVASSPTDVVPPSFRLRADRVSAG